MSLTPFEDILALSHAPSADPAMMDTIKEVMELKIQLDSMLQLVPNDQDDLVEDQEMWCVRWQKLLSQVHVLFQCVKEHSVDTALEAGLLIYMQEANALLCWWLDMAAIQKWQDKERVGMVALAWVAKVASSDKQEQVSMSEKAVDSVVPSLVQESANELLTTESPSKEQESVSSTGQKQKISRTLGHVSSQVVVDEEEDEEDKIIEVAAPMPSKVQASSKMMKCGKSKRKGEKVKKDMVLVLDPKAKGKEKGHLRSVCNNACVVIPVYKALITSFSRVKADIPDFFRFFPLLKPDSDHEDDDTMPCKKAKILDLAQHAAVRTIKLALLTMRMKMHGMLSFLTELQACAKVAKTYIGS
ncbi:hypothetical protein HD554DRAFT_2172447 [Boletus coccyginus]|nr:hypothetical protein HD554DRAFT_2172447 [Boletus coccyginus]